MRILLIEDEVKLAEHVLDALRRNGFAADHATDGESGLQKAEIEEYAAIILDLGLPKIDGMSVLKNIRASGMRLPIIILSARGSWSERVDGINGGADDYLTKPFQMEELLARLRAVLRREGGQAINAIVCGGLTANLSTSEIHVSGSRIDLTATEYRLVNHLITNLGRTCTATELADAIYSHNHDRDINAIEALVARVRKKIGPGYIETRRGFGYRMVGK
jgi:two-component system, OmpR family, response regulator